MIKIEITDPHLIDKKALQETAVYLMALTGGKIVIPEPPMNMKEINEPTHEQLETFAKVHHAAGRQFLDKTVEECFPLVDIIEEELIPVGPEVVNIPPAPSAAEVFKPVSVLPIPTPPAVSVSSVELDIQGLPWDMRIHARTKTKMKDGSWKKLRGIGPATVKQVETELRGVQSIPVPPPSAPVTAAEGNTPTLGFSDLMTLVTSAITTGKIKREQVLAILKPLQLPSLALVSTRLDLIPSIIESINGVINGTR